VKYFVAFQWIVRPKVFVAAGQPQGGSGFANMEIDTPFPLDCLPRINAVAESIREMLSFNAGLAAPVRADQILIVGFHPLPAVPATVEPPNGQASPETPKLELKG
jgi:hypothetical protein